MERILKGWNFVRIVRLVFGVVICWQAFATKEWLLFFAGLFFAGTAVYNIGCCGMSACQTFTKPAKNPDREITYEEMGN